MTPDLADFAEAIRTEFARQRQHVLLNTSLEEMPIHGTFDLLAVARAVVAALPDPGPKGMTLARRRELAGVAAHQASLGLGELLNFVAGADDTLIEISGGDCAELLLDAAKITLEVLAAEADARGDAPDPDRNQVQGAISRYLEGWV